MCRILLIKSDKPFNSKEFLEKFSSMAHNSKEFQGDGWGVIWQEKGIWNQYKSLNPIWNDDLNFIPSTNFLLAHARSAFNNTGPDIKSTMPFMKNNKIFLFNGELKNVRIQSTGYSGAEKLFNLILRIDKGDYYQSILRTISTLEKQSSYIRASNFILTDQFQIYINCYYNEDSEYFSLRKKIDENTLIVCSEQLDDYPGWEKIPNRTVEVYSC